jgi:glutaminyl-tRNA synthetase
LEILTSCKLEPALADAGEGERYQFIRKGYFFLDPIDLVEGKMVFNRIVSLRDTWAKIQKKS